ncbi:MAG: TetR/AcrR family transcriptional regulator [Burkholderiales bacterium]
MKSDDPARRRALRSAAARLFRETGYAGATVRDIARAVGIQSGSIFYYYGSKEDILVDVMDEGMSRFVRAAERPAGAPPPPRERLRSMIVGHLEALHGRSDEVAVVLSEWRSLSPASRRRIVKLRDRVDAMWDEALGDAAKAGLVGGDLKLLRLALLGAMNWSLQWYAPKGALSITTMADRILDLFVREPGRGRRPARSAKRRRSP